MIEGIVVSDDVANDDSVVDAVDSTDSISCGLISDFCDDKFENRLSSLSSVSVDLW